MAEIRWSVEAERGLRSTYEYIAADNVIAAERVVNGIYDKVQLLRRHPRLGQRYELIADREVREIIYGHYRIPYRIFSEELIEILGVFHGAMDLGSYLE